MINNFKLTSTEGDFSLYTAPTEYVYKTYKIKKGYIRNTKTGDNCGHEVKLMKHRCVGTKQNTFTYDEDCYEFVLEE